MTIFKACDIRGVVGQQWDVPEARAIGQSLGQMLRRRGHTAMIVGGDFRRSTPRLREALTEGLCGVGITVHDVGQAPTPVIQFAARHLDCRNVAIITASHNPGRYNGVKFLIDGWPPVPELMQELQKGCHAPHSAASCGQRCPRPIVHEYEAWILEASRRFVETEGGNTVSGHDGVIGQATPHPTYAEPGGGAGEGGARRRIVLDTMGGAFTHLARRILTAADYEVISIDDQLDPDFARRDPNPAVDANLHSVSEAVLHHQADLGLALDGDGDRVIFLDARGTIARPEQIASILIRHCLGRCTVVYDLKCASVVARTAEQLGGRAIMRPSGHGFIKQTLLEEHAALGVEVSGHHFFGYLEGGDDGLFTALVLLQLLERSRQTLATWLAEVGWPAITPDVRIAYDGDAGTILDRIAEKCGGHVTRLDGVRAQYDTGWALARASITEPKMTFRFEGTDDRQLRTIVSRFLASSPELYTRVLEKLEIST